MSAPLPPGNPGLPFLGETLAMLKNPYQFQAERRERYGPIFRSRILGREFVFLSGPEGMTAFLDPDRVSRQNGHPAHVRALFGGLNMGMLDGPRPTVLKKILLAAFTPQALDRYVPEVEELVTAALSRWSARAPGPVEADLRALAVGCIARNVLGIPSGAESDAIVADYVDLAAGFLSPPVDLPGTTFRRARTARDRQLARLRATVAEHRAKPTQDGLSIALGTAAEDGTPPTDEELVLELNHSFLAGYIVYALLAELLVRLRDDAPLRDRARDEVQRVTPSGPLSMAVLGQLRTLGHIVMEAKRTAPIVPFAFGSAKRTFELGGFTIPEGWGVQMALSLSNADPSVFAEPHRFDPERYAEPRAEHTRHPHAWHPQGSGPPEGHRCLGLEYSTMIAEVFLVHLLRGYDWDFPAQDLGRRWDQIPAGFVDGLRVALTARPA
jgi:cytochrome P450